MRYTAFCTILLVCLFVFSTQSAHAQIDPAKEADIRHLTNSMEAVWVEILRRIEVAKKEMAETDEPERQEELKTSLRKWKELLDNYAIILADDCLKLGELEKELAETDQPERQEELKTRLTLRKQKINFMADRLADAYFTLGELDKAIEVIGKAISVDPENKEYHKLLEKYQQAKKVNR